MKDAIGLRFLFVAVFVVCPALVMAEWQRPEEELRLKNPEPMVQAGFGVAMAFDDNIVLVGAPYAVSRTQETGKAYVFERQSGRLLHTLSPPKPVGDDRFGMSVGIAGDLLVIGAPQARGKNGYNNGAVYLFAARTGALVHTIYNPNPSGEIFGHAVAGDAQRVLVGDPGESSRSQFHVGGAYLFDAKTGRLVLAFHSPDSKEGEADRFGHAVGFVGSSVVVAAPLGGRAPVDSGVVYVFDPESGASGHLLSSPNPQSQEYFGWSLAAGGKSLIIGAPGHREGHMTSGIAYVFTKPGGFHYALQSPTPVEGERFGEAVGIERYFLLVGAPGHVSNGVGSGVVHLFDRRQGGYRGSIKNPEVPTGVEDAFGSSIKVSADSVIIGSPFGGRARWLDAGVVHQFRLTGPTTIER